MAARCLARLVPLLLAGGAGACSLTAVDFTPCEHNAECRDAFGWGHVCNTEGLCDQAPTPSRCRKTIPEDLLQDPQAYADRLLVGSVYDDVAFDLEEKSIELAIRQANDAEGLQGQLFGYVHCTNVEGSFDELDQETANVEMARYLAEQIGVPALVGPASSGRTEAAYVALAGTDTLIISPSATSPALTALDGLSPSDASPGLLWRTAPPDSLQGVAIAVDMEQRGVTQVAVIHQSGPYGEGLAEAFANAFGGQVDLYAFDDASLRDEQIVDAGAQLAAVAAPDVAEALFISSEKSDTVAFLNGIGTNPDYGAVGLFLPDGGFDVAIFEQATEGASRFDAVRGSRPSPADTESLTYKAFVSAFSSAYGESPETSGFTPYAFDASWLVIYGMAWSQLRTGRLSGTGIAQGLRRVSDGEALPIRPTSWPSVVANFGAGRGIDVEGASGALDYDPLTEETVSPIDLWYFDGATGELATLCTLLPGQETEALCPGWPGSM
ncbi:MAG: ABC transporter substrate-binding protein [Myxococcales bacterium]|nr:ABC transporter substrate-binding protein [Myxococcales bacterium]